MPVSADASDAEDRMTISMSWPWWLDPEIDRVGRSSRSFDVGVELSQKSRRKLSWSIESIVRLW